MTMRRLWLTTFVLLTVAALPACKSSGQTKGDESAGTSKPAEPPPGGFEASEPASSEALDALPADTLMAVLADDPFALADRLGRRKLVEQFDKPYERLKAQVTRTMGHNLLTPDGWEAGGVDPHGAAGLFWLTLQDEVGGAFVTLSDRDAFVEWVRTRAEELDTRSWKVETTEGATFMHPEGRGDDGCFLVRKNHAYLIASYDHDGESARTVAERFARRPDGEGLGSAPAFQKVRSQLRYGSQVLAFQNLEVAMRDVRALMDEKPHSGYREHIQDRLEAARERGDEEAVARYEKRIAEFDERQENQQKSQTAVLELTEEMWGSLPGMGVGLQVEGAAVRAKAVLPGAMGESTLGDLLGPEDGTHAILSGLDEVPLAVSSARFDVEAALGLFERGVEAVGESEAYTAWKQRVADDFGIDIETEVFERLTGEIGVYVDGDLFKLMSGGDAAIREVTGGLVVGVEEAAKVDAMIAEAIERFGMGRFIQRRALSEDDGGGEGDDESEGSETKKGVWEVGLPGGKTLRLQASDGYLTLSTKGDFHARVAGTSEAASTTWLDDSGEGPLALLSAKGAPFIGHVEVGLMGAGMLSFLQFRRSFSSAMAGKRDAVRYDEPDSEAIKEKKAELEEVDAQIDELRTSEHDSQQRMVRRFVELFGDSAFAVRPEGDALAIYVGRYLGAESVGAAVDEAIEAWKSNKERLRKIEKKSDTLREKRRKLREELHELRKETLREKTILKQKE